MIIHQISQKKKKTFFSWFGIKRSLEAWWRRIGITQLWDIPVYFSKVATILKTNSQNGNSNEEYLSLFFALKMLLSVLWYSLKMVELEAHNQNAHSFNLCTQTLQKQNQHINALETNWKQMHKLSQISKQNQQM